jgi:endonuclease/exonuclease/phosphatase family metal-dependent hydrolase
MRVVTFNIRHGAGLDRRVDLDRIARVIAASGAEVAGLQEVDRHYGPRSGFVDQPAYLADRLGMEVVFGANLGDTFGNAVLSAHPIVRWQNVHLDGGDREQRGLLRAEIDAGGHRWPVYVTHLENEDAAIRLDQARLVADLVGVPDGRTALLADLNAEPGSPELRVLSRNLVAAEHGPTFPAVWPCRRIDHVLCSADLRVDAAVMRSITASDHRPVVADLA